MDGAELAVDPQAVRGAVGERQQGPWAGIDERTVAAHLRTVADALDAHPVLAVGQGCASLVQVTVTFRDPARLPRNALRWVPVVASRLAPLPLVAAVDEVLQAHGLTRLDPVVLSQRVDPEIVIDTNLGDPPFTVFDAWFHWWD